MNILGIETSCDETAVAIVRNGTRIVINLVSSQEKIHRKYHGVVPEIASRAHLENINWLLEQTLLKTGRIDAVAVTVGPGLIGSLFVGVMTAKTLAYLKKVPLIGVNHLEGHVFANFIEKVEGIWETEDDSHNPFTIYHLPFTGYFPCVALIVSGGHTDLVYIEKIGKYKFIGRTRDDAVGECYDKVAKLLNLGYPGGPAIDKLAVKGDSKKINFPRPFMRDSWDFSFSGLKTAVVNYVNNEKFKIKKQKSIYHSRFPILDLCASFQQSVVDVLVEKTFRAAKQYRVKTILLGGGVSANRSLRQTFSERGKQTGINVKYPPIELCTDNAAMVASVGYFKIKYGGDKGDKIDGCWDMGKEMWGKKMRVDPELPLKSWNKK